MSIFWLLGEAKISGGEPVIMHIINNGPPIDITRIQHQVISTGDAWLPNSGNYLSLEAGQTYSLGGKVIQPVNISDDGESELSITAHDSEPFLEGESLELNRWYTKELGEMSVWDERMLLKSGETIALKYKNDQKGGRVFIKMSFEVNDRD